MWESHPFTIASAGAEGEGDGEPLRVFVKSVKRGWTERLFGFASDGEAGTGEDRMRFGGAKAGRRCRVLVEGPYGSFSLSFFLSFLFGSTRPADASSLHFSSFFLDFHSQAAQATSSSRPSPPSSSSQEAQESLSPSLKPSPSNPKRSSVS